MNDHEDVDRFAKRCLSCGDKLATSLPTCSACQELVAKERYEHSIFQRSN